MITILIYSVGTFLSGLATDMWTLLAARAITGFGVGGEWAVAHALVGETVPPHVRGRYGSYLQSGAAFARFFATITGNLLAPWIGWRWSFMLSALPALMVVVIRRQMPESDVWLAHQRESAGTRRVSQLRIVSEMLGPALRKTTALALTVTTCNMAAYWFKTIWLPTYFHEIRGLSLQDSTQLFFMDQLGSLVGYAVFGFASDHLGRRPSFTLFSIAKALGLIVVTVGWDTVAGSPALLYGAMLVVRFGEGNWGCIGPHSERGVPDTGSGRGAGDHLQPLARRAVSRACCNRVCRDAFELWRRHCSRGAVRAARRRHGLGVAGDEGRAADGEGGSCRAVAHSRHPLRS